MSRNVRWFPSSWELAHLAPCKNPARAVGACNKFFLNLTSTKREESTVLWSMVSWPVTIRATVTLFYARKKPWNLRVVRYSCTTSRKPRNQGCNAVATEILSASLWAFSTLPDLSSTELEQSLEVVPRQDLFREKQTHNKHESITTMLLVCQAKISVTKTIKISLNTQTLKELLGNKTNIFCIPHSIRKK